jgi:hypothetical protein
MENKLNIPTEIVELPSLGLIYPESSPLSSGKIEMKYMTAREEDILTNQNYIQKGTVLDELVKSLIVSNINYDDLCVGDKNAVLVAARILGYGKDYSFSWGGEEYNIDLTTIDNKPLDEKVFNRFVAIFNDPQSLNPEKYRARVTREVADTLAKLARWLEQQGHEPKEVANFLMRCIFTMFAEDVKLLPGEVFTKALKERWLVEPKTFKTQIERLWKVMNTGGEFNFDEIPQFNGSFFAHATAFDLPKEQLEVLYEAANKDWT